MIVADYHIPGLDSLELLRAVRSGQIDTVAHGIPFIMVTGEGKLESFISAIQLDVDAFLDKPTTRILLETWIKSLIGEQKVERKIKDPSYYQDMDVESARYIFALIETVLPDDAAAEKEMTLKNVAPDAILSRELMHGTGHALLAAHTRLNEEIFILLQKIDILSGGIGNLWDRT